MSYQLSTSIIGWIDARKMEHDAVLRLSLSRALLQATDLRRALGQGEQGREDYLRALAASIENSVADHPRCNGQTAKSRQAVSAYPSVTPPYTLAKVLKPRQ